MKPVQARLAEFEDPNVRHLSELPRRATDEQVRQAIETAENREW